MKVKQTYSLVQFLNQYAEKAGVTIAEVEIKNSSITIYIDKQGGVDLDTCALFHGYILEPIDQFDPTYGEPYTLNVSSLGIDRPFKTEKDFLDHIGQKVEVKLKDSIRGKKFYEGILTAYTGTQVTLKVDAKNTFTIDMKNLVKMNEFIDFE